MVRTEHQPATTGAEQTVETSEVSNVLDRQQLTRREKVWNRLMLFGFASAVVGAAIAAAGVGISISDISPHAPTDANLDTFGQGAGLFTFGTIATSIGLPMGVVGAVGKMIDKPNRELVVTQRRIVK